MDLSRKKQVIAELERLMRARRAEIDPKVLAMARAAVEKKAAGLANAGETVPYDRDAAAKAVEMFLDGHPEKDRFRAALVDFIGKKSH